MTDSIVVPIKSAEVKDAVSEAVYLVFGGVSRAAEALGITAQAIRRVIYAGSVATRSTAERWELATVKAGQRIPKEELIGWVKWRGRERHPDLFHGKRSASFRRRIPPPSGFYPTPAPADAHLAA